MIRPTRRGGLGGSDCRCRGVRRRDVTLVMTTGYDRLRVYCRSATQLQIAPGDPLSLRNCKACIGPPPSLPLAIPLHLPTGHLVFENGIRLYTILAAQEKTPTPLQG